MSSPINLNLKPVRNLYRIIASVVSPSDFVITNLSGTNRTLKNYVRTRSNQAGHPTDTKVTGIEYAKFRLGNSETPVYSPDKYDVQAPIDESGIVFNTPVVNTNVNDDTGEIVIEVRQVIQNNKDTDITITEVGLVVRLGLGIDHDCYHNWNRYVENFLIAYGIPDNAITIPAGQSYEFIARVRVAPTTPSQ